MTLPLPSQKGLVDALKHSAECVSTIYMAPHIWTNIGLNVEQSKISECFTL